MKDGALKKVFTGNVGESISGMRYRILGPLYAQQFVTTFGEDVITIIDSLLQERHESYKNSPDIIARAAYYKVRAGLLSGALDVYGKLFESLSTIPHSHYQDVMKIFPSKSPLCELLTQDTDERVMETFYHQIDELEKERKFCFEQISKNMVVGVVPSICLKNEMLGDLMNHRNDVASTGSTQGSANVLDAWLKKELGESLATSLLAPDGAVELTDDQASNIISYVTSLTDVMNETSHSVTTLDFANHMCNAIGATSLITHNVTAALDFRTYAILPVNSIRETLVVAENKDETGAQPTLLSNDQEAEDYGVRVRGVIPADDCAVLAFLTAKIAGLARSALAGSTAEHTLLMGDLCMSAAAVIDTGIIERVVFESAKAAGFKEDLEWFNLAQDISRNKGKNMTLTEMSQRYEDAYNTDIQKVARMFSDTMQNSFMKDVGPAMDTIRAKDGTKKRWFYCPHKNDDFELSLNSGGLSNIATTGVVQMKTNRDVQYFDEWATGTTEGSSEGIICRSALRDHVYTRSLSQETVLEHAGDVLNYYYGGGKRIKFDFRAITAMQVIDSFRDGDRWYEPGAVSLRIYSSEMAKMCRTQPIGDNLIFSTMFEDIHQAPLAGTAMTYEEKSDSYVCVDKSIRIGLVAKRDGLKNHDDMRTTAGKIALLIVRDLLNGHFSQVRPEIATTMPVSLSQTSKRMQKRIAEFESKYDEIKVDGDIVARFQANPVLSRQIGDLFPAEERWERRYEEMFIRKDIKRHYQTLIDLHVRSFKGSLGSAGRVDLALRYVEGRITEADLLEMKRDERGINLINTLIQTITSVVGLRFDGNEATSKAPYELRVFLLQELHRKLAEFSRLKTKITAQDIN
jgi:hypothetical protein